MKTWRILRLSPTLDEPMLLTDSTDERADERFDGMRKELRGREIHDAVDARREDESSDADTDSFSALPMNGANGRGSVPSAV